MFQLQTLGDIEIAMKVLKEELDENPIDSHYKALNCELKPVDKTDTSFKVRVSTMVYAWKRRDRAK